MAEHRNAEHRNSEHRNRELADLQRSGGMWSQVYLDVSGDVEDPKQRAHLRRRTVRDALHDAGAPDADIDAIEDVLSEPSGIASPVSRFLLARDGSIELNDVLPGVPLAPDVTTFGPVPDLIPLLKYRQADFHYLVVEAGRDGGRIRAYRAGGISPLEDTSLQGRGDSLHKVQAGGWSHARYQHHTEEIWKQNEAKLADAVDDLVRRYNARLLVLAGDIRAIQLLEGRLAPQSRSILSTVSTYTRPEGSSDKELQKHIAEQIGSIVADDRRVALDRLGDQEGRSGAGAQLGVGPVVHALQQGQVETILLDLSRLQDRTLLALDAEPWVAAAPEGALTSSVLDSSPAAVVLARAAILGDADVFFVEAGDLPKKADVAAVFRWSVGPATPAA